MRCLHGPHVSVWLCGGKAWPAYLPIADCRYTMEFVWTRGGRFVLRLVSFEARRRKEVYHPVFAKMNATLRQDVCTLSTTLIGILRVSLLASEQGFARFRPKILRFCKCWRNICANTTSWPNLARISPIKCRQILTAANCSTMRKAQPPPTRR